MNMAKSGHTMWDPELSLKFLYDIETIMIN